MRNAIQLPPPKEKDLNVVFVKNPAKLNIIVGLMQKETFRSSKLRKLRKSVSEI